MSQGLSDNWARWELIAQELMQGRSVSIYGPSSVGKKVRESQVVELNRNSALHARPLATSSNRLSNTRPSGRSLSHRHRHARCDSPCDRSTLDGANRRASAFVTHDVHARRRAPGRPRRADRALTLSRRNQACIQSNSIQSAEKPRVFDLDAAVHHHRKTAAQARSAAASWMTPNCIHTTFAPIAMASSTIAGTAEGSRKISTTSTGGGTSRKEAYDLRPSTSCSRGFTGMTS